MGLFDKKTKKEEPKQGSIPKGLGIKQSRADEIIEAVMNSYVKNTSNVTKVFNEILGEKLPSNEHTFACYIVGCLKVRTDIDFEKRFGKLFSELEEIIERL